MMAKCLAANMYLIAKVNDDMHILGTNLQFKQGELVIASLATNVPSDGFYIWHIQDHEAKGSMSALVSDDEITILE